MTTFLPGRQVIMPAADGYDPRRRIELSCLGNVVSVSDCPVVENFKLVASTAFNGEERTQDIAPFFELDDRCGLPKMLYATDFNRDGYSDMVWAARSETTSRFYLLISDPENADIWTLADMGTLSPCAE
jgi:hypothetical protein